MIKNRAEFDSGNESRVKHHPTNPNAGGGECSEPFNSGGWPAEPRPNDAASCGGDASGVPVWLPPSGVHKIAPEFLSPSSVQSPGAMFQRGAGTVTNVAELEPSDGASNFQCLDGCP